MFVRQSVWVSLVLVSSLSVSAVRADDNAPDFKDVPVPTVAKTDDATFRATFEGVNTVIDENNKTAQSFGGALRLRVAGDKDKKRMRVHYRQDRDGNLVYQDGKPIVTEEYESDNGDFPSGTGGILEASLGKVGDRMVGSAEGKVGYRLTKDGKLGGRWGVEYEANYSRQLGTVNMDLVVKNRGGKGFTTLRLAPLGVFSKRHSGGTYGGYSGVGLLTDHNLFDSINVYAGLDAGILWGIQRAREIKETSSTSVIPGETTEETENGPDSETTTTTSTSTTVTTKSRELVHTGIDQVGSGSLLSAQAGVKLKLGENISIGIGAIAERMDYKTQETLFSGETSEEKANKAVNFTGMANASLAF